VKVKVKKKRVLLLTAGELDTRARALTPHTQRVFTAQNRHPEQLEKKQKKTTTLAL